MLVVSRQHHHFHALLTQPPDRIVDVSSDPVRDQHIAHISPAHGGMNRCTAALHLLRLNPQRFHEPDVAGIDPHPVDHSLNPQTGAFLYVANSGRINSFFVGIPERQRDRVAGIGFCVGCDLQKLGRSDSLGTDFF